MPIEITQNGQLIASPSMDNLRSEAVDEILSHKPGFLSRWALLIFLFILLVLLSSSWFIRYPDVVIAKAKLTSINAPKTIVSRTSGKLIKLNVTEGETVQAGTIIGFMESTADYEEVLSLSKSIDSISGLITLNKAGILSTFYLQPYKNLGDLQQPYQIFITAFIDYKNYLANSFYEKKKIMLQRDMTDLQKLNMHLTQQKATQQQDVALAEKTFDMNEKLKNEKVISDLEYRNEKSKLLMKQLVIPQINESIISNETQQNEKHKEIMELENTIARQRFVFEQAVHTLKSNIDGWKKQYMLIAPVTGRISFAGFVQENQQLQNNQTICFINPGNNKYFAEAFIPQQNFGKVKTGEKVLLKFSSYPSQEFGSIVGKVDFISEIPTDSGYLARIVLPKGLNTNYNKQIQYREGLQANAEIITQNLRLAERFYYNVKKEAQR